jgi:lipoic acid synthetase
VRAVHGLSEATVEVLVPDFQGRTEDVRRVLDAGPEVFNHNVETVPRLYPEVRPMAVYERSLAVLQQAAGADCVTKSGMMVGLGEDPGEVLQVMRDLREAGCGVLTVGQYLAPSPQHHEVAEFVTPEQFQQYEEAGLQMGFEAVAAGPFVRSSYGAAELAAQVLQARRERK